MKFAARITDVPTPCVFVGPSNAMREPPDAMLRVLTVRIKSPVATIEPQVCIPPVPQVMETSS
jgi:hypothetical protein